MNRQRIKKIVIGFLGLLAFCCCGLYGLSTQDDDGSAEVANNRSGGVEVEVDSTQPPTDTPIVEDEAEETAAVVPTEVQNTTVPTPSDTPTQLPATATMMPQVRVDVNTANVRSGPGSNYGVVDVVDRDVVLFVLASDTGGHWYNVVLDDGSLAWIAKSVVVDESDLTGVVVAETIPAPPIVPTSAATSEAAATSTLAPATTAPLPTDTVAPPEPVAVCDCSGDLYNCDDFGTHSAAQACFEYCNAQGAGDIHRLDRDNDNLVCESLP